MGTPRKPVEQQLPKSGEPKGQQPAPPPADDEYEDGDMATPKCDDPGDDDEPL